MNKSSHFGHEVFLQEMVHTDFARAINKQAKEHQHIVKWYFETIVTSFKSISQVHGFDSYQHHNH